MTEDDKHISNDNQEGPNNQDEGPSMATLLVVAAVLVGIAWFLATSLRQYGGVQDCVMQGRTNCVGLPDK